MKCRFAAIMLCVVLLLGLFPISVNASDLKTSPDDTVLADEYWALYSHEDAECVYNIHINIAESTGSFAIIYLENQDTMLEHSFSLDPEMVQPNSSEFWNAIVDKCYAEVSAWKEVDLTTAISVQTDCNQTSTYAVSDSTFKTYFTNWLVSKYGAQRQDSYVKGKTVNGITFIQYETVRYTVSKSNVYVINTAMTVAGVITGILGLSPTATLISVIGLFASVGGMITAGTRLDEYSLNVYWLKYVVAQGGTIKHSYAEKYINYIGYASSEMGKYSVDTESIYTTYNPSSGLFESDDAQFTAAYNSYMS